MGADNCCFFETGSMEEARTACVEHCKAFSDATHFYYTNRILQADMQICVCKMAKSNLVSTDVAIAITAITLNMFSGGPRPPVL